MTRNLEPIPEDSEIINVLPVVRDKCFVDLLEQTDVNQLHVVEDLNDAKGRCQSFGERFWDSITGKGAQRDHEITSRLINLMRGAYDSIDNLVKSQALSVRAIIRIERRFASLSEDVEFLAHCFGKSHERLNSLTKSVQLQFDEVEKWAEQTDAYLDAELQLETVFSQWEAERYTGFSLAGRCYAVLEELRWGKFGEYCRRHHRDDRRELLIKMLNDKAAAQMKADASLCSIRTRVPTADWTRPISGEPLADAQAALAYLGSAHQGSPFVSAVSQAWDGQGWDEDVYLRRVSLISSAERVAGGLVQELFRK